jgi:hypothetical protein
MERRSRRLLRASAIGTVLALAVSGTALAEPSAEFVMHTGTTHQEPTGDPPTVCEFHLHASVSGSAESGHWEIWTGDGGELVEAGTYDAAPGTDDVIPDTGTLTLENGDYQLRWDDEPIDRSRGTIDFTVDCPEPTPTPSATPTPTPTGGEAGETGTPDPTATPSESVLAETGTPRITLPPTDGTASDSGPSSSNAVGLAAILLLGSLALLVAVRPATAAVKVRRRR